MIASLCLLVAPVCASQSDSPAPAVSSATPQGSGLSYTFGELDFVATDVDGFSDDPDGIAVHGSYAFQPNWFAFGRLEHLDGRAGGSSIDIDTLSAGVGYHMPVAASTDLVLDFGLSHAGTDSGAPGGTADGMGYVLGAGVRHRATDKVEVDAGLDFSDYEHSSGNTALRVGAVYYAAPNLGFTAQLSASDDVDAFQIGLRFVP